MRCSLSFFSDYKDMVLAPCKLKQIREMIMWKFAVISRLLHFYGRISGYVLIYRGKDKNTTQGNLVEPVGSPVAPVWCKQPALLRGVRSLLITIICAGNEENTLLAGVFDEYCDSRQSLRRSCHGQSFGKADSIF